MLFKLKFIIYLRRYYIIFYIFLKVIFFTLYIIHYTTSLGMVPSVHSVFSMSCVTRMTGTGTGIDNIFIMHTYISFRK